MGILTEQRDTSGTYNPAQWLIDWVSGGSEVSSGVKVNESSALKYTPFWAAVRVISGTVAALPFLVYKRTENGGRERIIDHPVYPLLHDRPNEYMDAITFIETRQAHVLTYGNGFAEIQRNGAGKPIALWPLLPDRTFRKISPGGIPYYEVGVLTGQKVNIPDYNVLHIKGLGFDGYTGYNVVAAHKEAIGYGVAVKEYAGRFFSNSANPGGVLEHPNTLSDPAAKRLAESWNKESGGLTKAHRTRVLEEGMKWSQTGVAPEQAQALEVQKYTVDDCSRIFNIPPHKIGSLERATFSNIEEQNIDFVASTMLYWFRKWEQECNYKLFLPGEKKSHFCEILVEGLLRGKMLARAQTYASARQWGWLSVNDIRRTENLNPIGPEGDIYLEPANMKPAGSPDPKEMPAPDNPEPDKHDDDIRNAHRELIEGQWTRVINKQINSLKKAVNGDFYERMREYAATVMFDSVNACASINGVKTEQVRDMLDAIITKNINKNIKLTTEDAAKLTDEIFKKIGGNHAGDQNKEE